MLVKRREHDFLTKSALTTVFAGCSRRDRKIKAEANFCNLIMSIYAFRRELT